MTQTIKRNKRAFNDLADFYAEFPERYNQGKWGEGSESAVFKGKEIPCGSYMCIAGGTVAINEWRPKVYPGIIGPPVVDWYYVRHSEHEDYRTTPEVAAEILGLDEDERDILFDEHWRPGPMGLVEALRMLGDGASVKSVTDPNIYRFIVEC